MGGWRVSSPFFLLPACREGIWQAALAGQQLVGKQKEQLSMQKRAALEVAVVAGGHAASLDSASNNQRVGLIVGFKEKRLLELSSKCCINPCLEILCCLLIL